MILFRKTKTINKILAVILALSLLFNSGFTHSLALAEDGLTLGDSEATAQNQETGEESQNTADSGSSEQASVENNNEAEVINNVEAEANTGDNLADDPAEGGSAETQNPVEVDDLDGQEQGSSEQNGGLDGAETQTDPDGEFEPEGSAEATESAELNEMDSSVDGVVAENEGTGEGSENEAEAGATSEIAVENDNQAVVDNQTEAAANTGENEVSDSGEAEINTGDADAQVDQSNIVNTNIVASVFWQLILNFFESYEGDIDLTDLGSLEEGGLSDLPLFLVSAQNSQTGDGSINFAVANADGSFSVVNLNQATITNVIEVLASSGDNLASQNSGSAQITTGEAQAIVNLFNLVNTNLVGENWFFTIINLFADVNGDVILPYELELLLGEAGGGNSQILAQNSNTGESSENEAVAQSSNDFSVANDNEAYLENNVSAQANSGENQAIGNSGGSGVETGDASADVNLLNWINTNVVASRFVYLVINVFGNWTGSLLGWWGNLDQQGNALIAWAFLPNDGLSNSEVVAQNSETGEGSINSSSASSSESFSVENTNQAWVENQITVNANTGGNEASNNGGQATVNTGNASVLANIVNVLNTNITGSNWFFGMINIFGNFFGNIIFPRPDLIVNKAANQAAGAPGEEITYTISYKNQGYLWAKNVIISDIVPSYTTFVSASDGGTESGGVVTWNLGTVGKGEEGAVTITLRLAADAPIGVELTNQVLIETATAENEQGNNSAVANVLVSSSATSLTAGSSDSDDSGDDGCCPQPPEAPTLLSATRVSPTEVELSWTAVDGASHYSIAYGLSSGDYLYGLTNVGNVTSFTISELSPETTYYFVVAAVADGDFSSSSPFSNELASSWPGGVLGAQAAEGETGQALAAEEADEGEVEGGQTNSECWWWLILPLAGTGLLGAYYKIFGKKRRRFWWLIPIGTAALVYLGDQFIAHQYFTPSHFCQWNWLGSLLSGVVPTAFYFKLTSK